MRLGYRRTLRSLGAGLALIVAGLAVSGCQEVASNLVDSQPFELEEIKGTDLNRVKISDEVAKQIDLQTSRVRGSGKQKLVPHAALIYNPDGKEFVYTRPAPQTYVRAPVTVIRVVGDRAVLLHGPPVGTVIVTLGAAELLATEYEILNQHP